MKNFIVAGAVVLGFIAPITVALVSGVKLGTESAGLFLAFSWVIAIISGVLTKAIQAQMESEG